MKIQLITPAPLRFNNGNKITALRWARILRKLGHKVRVLQQYESQPCDLLIALHARRSHDSIRRFHDLHPDLPLIVVLTGTDLYRDIRTHRSAQRSLEMATRIVALQKMALAELPAGLRAKTRVIYQSAEPCIAGVSANGKNAFKVSVIGHLRREKDPLRAALATRRLPEGSRIEVSHIGRALDETLERRARAESDGNPRYRWLGELPHARTRRMLAQSDLTVITSRMEGSSNVLSEALVCTVPVIASKISGLIGTLGFDYPGYFAAGDTAALARLLSRAENDRRFYRRLKERCKKLAALASPQREIAAWNTLLAEIGADGAGLTAAKALPESRSSPKAKADRRAAPAGR